MKLFDDLRNWWRERTAEQFLPRNGRQKWLRRSGVRHEFIVIGLGRFGASVAETLASYNHDVLGIDKDPERVQHVSLVLPHVVQLDGTDIDALREIGAESFDTGIAAIGADFEANLVAVSLLLELGVKRVIAKARTRTQKKILQQLGAHEVILPEHQAGIHLGRRLSFDHFVDYLEISAGIGVVELVAPSVLWGHSLVECNLRQRMGLTVIAVHRQAEVIVNPAADFRIEQGDVLAVVGKLENAELLQ
jgi:trk system potassium uptake protein TrkA